jgi:heme/copper-type cytochrome/quinol oxidase subunit 2
MKIKVTVVSNEDEYKTWLATQTPFVAPPAAAVPAEAPKGDSMTAVKTGTVVKN